MIQKKGPNLKTYWNLRIKCRKNEKLQNVGGVPLPRSLKPVQKTKDDKSVASKNASTFYVLLLGPEPKETELYSEVIAEVAPCRIDILNRIDRSIETLYQSKYHLVIIDVATLRASTDAETLMRMDGLGLLELIKRLSPSTSVILMSDRATVEEAVSAIRMGAEDYLKKPFNIEAFKLAIKRGLDRKLVFEKESWISRFLNLLTSCQMISATLEQEKIFKIIQSYFSMELGTRFSGVYRIVDRKMIRVYQTEPVSGDRAMDEVLDISAQTTLSTIQKMRETGTSYTFIERGQLTPGLFVFRFHCVGEEDNFYVCLSPSQPDDAEALGNRLNMFRTQIEVTGKNIRQYQGVRDLAYLDDVTGLYNQRYLTQILDREIRHSRASNHSFAVLFIDADHFKLVNDQHGHLIGSKLLVELGRQLKSFIRGTDTIFRYGGDEFVVVLSPCDIQTAKAVAERMRNSVESRAFLADQGLNIHFTVSIGVALFPEHAASEKEILHVADQVMYKAKKSRNSVYFAEKEKTI